MFVDYTILLLYFIVFYLSLSIINFKTPIYSTLCLALVFFLSIITLFFYKVEFLSYIYFLIYIGGIVMLFLFVIIMLNIKVSNMKLENNYNIWSNSFFFLLILKFYSVTFLILKNVCHTTLSTPSKVFNWPVMLDFISNDIMMFGILIYTHYFFCFLILGVILLVAMIGVIVLTFNS